MFHGSLWIWICLRRNDGATLSAFILTISRVFSWAIITANYSHNCCRKTMDDLISAVVGEVIREILGSFIFDDRPDYWIPNICHSPFLFYFYPKFLLQNGKYLESNDLDDLRSISSISILNSFFVSYSHQLWRKLSVVFWRWSIELVLCITARNCRLLQQKQVERFQTEKGSHLHSGMPVGELVLMQLSYELFATCTAIVAHDKDGKQATGWIQPINKRSRFILTLWACHSWIFWIICEKAKLFQ